MNGEEDIKRIAARIRDRRKGQERERNQLRRRESVADANRDEFMKGVVAASLQSVVDEFAKEELLGRVDVHADRVIASVETVSFLVLIEFVDGKPTGYKTTGGDGTLATSGSLRDVSVGRARELFRGQFISFLDARLN